MTLNTRPVIGEYIGVHAPHSRTYHLVRNGDSVTLCGRVTNYEAPKPGHGLCSLCRFIERQEVGCAG